MTRSAVVNVCSRAASSSGSQGKAPVSQAVGSSSNGWKTLTVRFRRERPRDGVDSSTASKAIGRIPVSQASRTTSVSRARWVDESVGRVGIPRAAASWETCRTGSTTPSIETDGTIGRPAFSQRRVPSAPSRMLTDSHASADVPRNSRAAAQLAQAGCQKRRISGMSATGSLSRRPRSLRSRSRAPAAPEK